MREEQVGDVTVLTPAGTMDMTSLPAFDRRVTKLVESGTRALVWDLSEVGMIPSTAAGFLIAAGKRLRDAGGRMVLAGLQQRVLGVLKTMGVADVFRIFQDRDAALAALG